MQEKIIFITGVSGVGKSTIGSMLAENLNIPFYDGDDYHSSSNITKMSNGIPLKNKDRKAWLLELNRLSIEHSKQKGCVIACSALKPDYRKVLSYGLGNKSRWVYLHGSYEQVYGRISRRKGHFMSEKLLKSQFDALIEPSKGLKIHINTVPAEIVNAIKEKI